MELQIARSWPCLGRRSPWSTYDICIYDVGCAHTGPGAVETAGASTAGGGGGGGHLGSSQKMWLFFLPSDVLRFARYFYRVFFFKFFGRFK
jgi:hypothetical protein